jgi:hypothetical protein
MVGGTATLLVLALLLLAAAIVGILSRPMAAQVDGGGSGSRRSFENVVRADVYLEYDQLPAGRTCRFAVIFDVQEGWHVNANPPSPDNLIPIQVNFKSKAGLRMVPIDYPEGEETKVDFSPEPAMCHSGRFAVRGILEVPCDAGGQSDEMEIQIKYQTCNDKICLPPKTVKLKAAPQIAVAGAPVRPVNPKLFTPRDDE